MAPKANAGERTEINMSSETATVFSGGKEMFVEL